MIKLPSLYPVPTFIRHRGLKLIYKVLTWRSRRMIFLSSLYGMLTEGCNPDKSHIEKLTKVLNVAKKSEALEFPIAIKSVIWKKRLPDGIEINGRVLHVQDLVKPDIMPNDCELILKNIIDRTPNWLHYAKRNQMAYDLKCLVNHIRTSSVFA